MDPELSTEACLSAYRPACRCALHSRRIFSAALLGGALGGVLAVPALAQPAADEGVRRDVGKESFFARLASAEQVEGAAGQQYRQMLQQAGQQKALGPMNHPQVIRLRAIADRIIPYTPDWNPRAKEWKWEVNLLGSKELNAFCMPGGKIAFYYGILARLQLSDDEVAIIMGHEMGHALREHARAQMGKGAATQIGAGLASALLGLGNTGNQLLGMGAQVLTLKFSRDDESEADIVGLDLAARAGYDPRTGVTLWQKMLQASDGAPPAILSSHPSGPTRIKDIEAKLPKVMPLYERAEKPNRVFGPPPLPKQG
jgi:predicted Zn-dependent protease